jgi:hypothetical protein
MSNPLAGPRRAYPDGLYCVVSVADPENCIVEPNDTNDASSRKVRLTGGTVEWKTFKGCRGFDPREVGVRLTHLPAAGAPGGSP